MSGHDALAGARLRAARIARLEGAWPGVLPAIAAVCGFAALTELALPQRLPLWLHLSLLLLLLGFGFERIWHTLRHLPAPLEAAIDRRIEQRSGLKHRPLQTLADRPAGPPHQLSDTLWQTHRARTTTRLAELRTGWPRLDLQQPTGRLLLVLLPLLAASAVLAGPAALPRLASGFLPGLFELPEPLPWMQAWITPPNYARTAPVFLNDPHGETTVPFGSVLQVNLTGVNGSPRIVLREAAAGSNRSRDFTRLSEGSWSLTATLKQTTGIVLHGNGHRLADWTVRVEPLPASVLAWNGAPGASTELWRTRLPWRIGHPYGLNSLGAAIRLADPKTSTPPLRVPIPIAPGTREAHGVAMPDLSADPRAGEPVVARLVATDINGHTTEGADARFTLPARQFRNPLARAVLDARKRLALGRETRVEAATDLEALGEAPGQLATDSGMFLNLSSVVALLRNDDAENDSAVAEATGRLWELALALEDGLHNDRAGARAAADVRAAREAVSAQLERMRELGDKGQSDQEQSELQRRIESLSRAIARRMQALAQQAQRQHMVLPPMPDARMLNGGDLARMMQQMRDDAAHGHAQEAMQRLAQMQSMLDRMRAATPQDLQNAQAQAQAQREAREQMQGLQDLVRRQSALLDQTQARHSALEKAQRARQPVPLDPQTAELLRRLGIPQTDTEAAPTAGDETPPDPADESQAQADADARAHMAKPNTAQPPDAENQAGGGQTGGGQTSGGQTSGGQATGSRSGDGQAEQGSTDENPAEAAQQAARAAQRKQDGRVQHGLARALDELGQEFRELSGQRPGGFDEAGREMEKARQALSAGRDQPAQDAQQQALADLQKGAKQMRQMMSSGTSGSPMLMPGMADGSGGSGADEPGDDQDRDGQPGPRDPLGRPVASGPHDPDGETHVPDKINQMRAREIEQELRRRDTDRTRPEYELNYLERLLKPF